MRAAPNLSESGSNDSGLQPSPMLKLALAYVQEVLADDLGLDSLLNLARLCWKAGLVHEASAIFDQALLKAKGFRHDFRRGGSLVSCAKAFRECGMTRQAKEALDEAAAVYRGGSQEFFLRGVLMGLVVEYAMLCEWESALTLASSCPDSETRHESARIVVVQMAKCGLWSEAIRAFQEHFPRGNPARARALLSLASVALEARMPESEQTVIIAQLGEQSKRSS